MTQRTRRSRLPRQPRQAEIEAALDEICRRDFGAFVQRFFPLLNGGKELMLNWHIDALIFRLERVRLGKSTRLVENLPPGYLKSELTSVLWVAFVLGNDPAKRIIVISHGAELAVALANAFRMIVSSNDYKRLFSRMRVSRTKNTEYEVATTAGGFRLAATIDGAITGRHADIIIIDDPLKAADASSKNKREHVNEIYRNTIVTRLNDKRTGAIIVVMQRLHVDDLCGYVLKGPDPWDAVILRAIATRAEDIPIGEQRYYRRQEGEVLHAEWESLEDLKRQHAQMGADYWAAQYQQEPIPPDGALVKRQKIRRYERVPVRVQGSYVLQSWDTALRTDERNSYTVCITFLVYEANYYVLDVFRDRLEFPELRAKAEDLARRYKPDRVVVEDSAFGQALVDELKKSGYRAIHFRPEGNKVARMSVQTVKIENGQVFLPTQAAWLDDFEAELFAFPNAPHDDQVDALSQALAQPKHQGYVPWTDEHTKTSMKCLARLLFINSFADFPGQLLHGERASHQRNSQNRSAGSSVDGPRFRPATVTTVCGIAECQQHCPELPTAEAI
jgi:predicted phage terminase large subunit-like protein